jgi:hypothetical protein
MFWLIVIALIIGAFFVSPVLGLLAVGGFYLLAKD